MKVSDADKDASAALAHELGMSAEEFTSGAADIIVQAFARHRHEAIEMAAKVADNAVYVNGLSWQQDAIATAIRALNGCE